MNKLIRDGRVAVVYSPNIGVGWYSWHKEKRLLHHPVVVELVEQNRQDEITPQLMQEILGVNKNNIPYLGAARCNGLQVAWLSVDEKFEIVEKNGVETIVPLEQ